MMRHLALAVAVALGSAFVAPVFAQQAAQQPAAQQTPTQVVQGIAQQLDTAVAGHKAELKQNREKLIGVINSVFLPHFDVDYAAILVLGQHAREATPEQRSQFSKAFYNSITRRYAEGLLDYTSGAVKVLPTAAGDDLNDKRSVVRTQVATGDGKTVSVDFAFRKTASGEWKAYDVSIEGISYITNYRNQVDAEIRKVGLDQLIKNLQTQGDQALKSMEQQAGGKPNGG
ncbi:ABC transporter substrate-binding protein [Rhodanobacter sp. 7MK24]|uniref:MlaC/ttg2D family ABC transporter substrate-binding protein n=1 Tax=Rhodanobacter sp. 7MK24 TaxID=2775922 RepID=UPI00177BC606|nr:ABC transporter substrate-binding protein [Rhodanobacter sp. 7MK24]MBD8881093.1 ABC transporter substrate-binding protein [Rhodanobacter sp. 7MK24]